MSLSRYESLAQPWFLLENELVSLYNMSKKTAYAKKKQWKMIQ